MLRILSPAFICSVAVHAAVLGVLVGAPRVGSSRPVPMEFTLVTVPSAPSEIREGETLAKPMDAPSPATPARRRPPPRANVAPRAARAAAAAPATAPTVPTVPTVDDALAPPAPETTAPPAPDPAPTRAVGPYAEGDVDSAPRLVGEVRPPYPAAPLRMGVEGDVVLALVVDVTGRVIDARVTRGAGHGFDEAALGVARRLHFTPGRKAGAAVAVRVTWTCRFRLEE